MRRLFDRLRALSWRRIWGRQLQEALCVAPLPSRGSDRWLLGFALICLIVGGSLVLACGYHAGFQRLNAFAAASPSWLWACLTSLGDERVVFALTLFFSLRHPRIFWTLILAALIAIAYSRGFKALFDTLRPPAVLAADAFHLIGPAHTRHSFPSGHSVTAGVFFGVLVLYTRWIELRMFWLLVALLVGFSRVAVGVHWPVDVAFGLMGGALAAFLAGWLATRWSRPASVVRLHLAFVVLAFVLALTLVFDDGGYSQAALMLRLLGLAAILSTLLHYIVLPAIQASPRASGEDLS